MFGLNNRAFLFFFCGWILGCGIDGSLTDHSSIVGNPEEIPTDPTTAPPVNPTVPGPGDLSPEGFDFIDLLNSPLAAVVLSDVVQIQGIGSPVSLNIEGSGGANFDITEVNQKGLGTYWIGDQDVTPTSLNFKPDGSKMYILGQVSDTIHQYALAIPWDISTAVVEASSFSVAGEDTSPYSVSFKPDGTKMYVLGAVLDVVYQYTLSTPWDVSTATYDILSFSATGEDTSGRSISFKPDGSKMYYMGANTNSVYQYTLATPWNISTASYDTVTFSVNGEDTSVDSLVLKPDGTKMYMIGSSSDSIHQYTLATPWDLSTASYDTVASSVFAQDNTPVSISFKPDGSKVFYLGDNSNIVYEYGASVPWDVSAVNFDRSSFSVNAQDSGPNSVEFKFDGTKMFIMGQSTDSVYQYSLSTPWDVSTARYDNSTFLISSEETDPRCVRLKPDGTKMYVIGASSDSVHQYTLVTPWDVSTAVYDIVAFSITTEESTANSFAFNPEGSKMYVVGDWTDTVYQYSLATPWDMSTASYDTLSFPVVPGTVAASSIRFNLEGSKMFLLDHNLENLYQYTLATPWDITTASYDNLFLGVGGQESNPYGLGVSLDGSKIFLVGPTSDRVHQFILNTPWDISVVIHDPVSFSVSGQDSTPHSLNFKPDGLKMYVLGDSSNSIYQYTLSTAWDPSTARYDSVTFSVGGEETNPNSFAIKPDGSKMYVLGEFTDGVYQYTLGTPWDLSTASYDTVSFPVAGEDTSPHGIIFKPDGSKMYMAGSSTNSIHQYTLVTPWDLSTAVYDIVALGVGGEDSNPVSLDFKPDGVKLYMLGDNSDRVHQYTLGTPWDLSTAVYDILSFSIEGQDRVSRSIRFKPDGSVLFMMGDSTNAIYRYPFGFGGHPEYRVCQDILCSTVLDDWRRDGLGVITNLDYVQLRLTTGGQNSATSTAVIVVGEGSADWQVTTIP